MAKNGGNEKKREFKIPDEVKSLMKLTYKKFKKENKDYYDSKKELKKAYYSQVIDSMPDAIALLVKYGYKPELKETKDAIYTKIMDPDLIKYLKKEIKDGLEFNNMVFLPVLINDIVSTAAEAKKAAEAENPDTKVEFDLTDLIELSHMILKKKMKKLTKAGIDENVAFDVLSVIPSAKILSKSQHFHLRSLFTVIYEHAKTKEINFEKLVDIIFKDDEDYISSLIVFALLERKEKIGNFTDSQKKLFNDITEYCFKTLEDMKKEDITAVLKSYCDARKRDEAQNKDTNRRYYISSLPESDYPNITKVVAKMVDQNENLKKYF